MDSAELIDMIAGDASSTEVSDALKDMMYAKGADFVKQVTPDIAAGMFGDEVPEEQPEAEVEQPEANAEVETQDQVQQEEE
tara:strand:- start:10 stop:252 length:243 start_codon:yes stop_codon:yes gene_type:complete